MVDTLIQPTRRVTRVDSVVERIRDFIDSSQLKSGDRLPGELELAEQLNVSRSVVREAISRLQTVGLLTVVRGRSGGTFVGDPDSVLSYANVVRSALSISDNDTQQFAEFRAALEIYTARRAAEVATEEDVAELERLSTQIGQAEVDDTTVAADFQFHYKLAEIAGNQVILHTLQLSREFIDYTIRNTGPNDPKISQQQHLAVVDAIHRADPAAAEQAMRIHMESVIEHLMVNTT